MGLKIGKWVTKCSVIILAHEPLECQENKTYVQPKGMYTMDEEKGVDLLSGPLWDVAGVSNVRDKSTKSPAIIKQKLLLISGFRDSE